MVTIAHVQNSNITPRLSDHFATFGLVFFVLKSLLRIARQWICEKFAILSLKPRSRVRILVYQTWAIKQSLYNNNNNNNNNINNNFIQGAHFTKSDIQ